LVHCYQEGEEAGQRVGQEAGLGEDQEAAVAVRSFVSGSTGDAPIEG
jgi:hypothetical protein